MGFKRFDTVKKCRRPQGVHGVQVSDISFQLGFEA